MVNKNYLTLGILSVLMLISNISTALAQDDIFTDWMRFIFIDLSSLAEGGDQIFVIYFKIFLFFLVFAVLFWAGEKVFGEQKNIAVTVSLLISLISIILLPGEYVLLIFQTYSAIIGYVFIILPVIIGAVVANKLSSEMDGHEHIKRIITGIIFIVIAILTFSLSATLIAEGDDVYYGVAQWARIGGVISLFVGLYYMITFGKKDDGGAAPAVK